MYVKDFFLRRESYWDFWGSVFLVYLLRVVGCYFSYCLRGFSNCVGIKFCYYLCDVGFVNK